jgi:hypothetical protein
MKRWERWSFNLCALAVAVSGFAYLWMKYFVQAQDPFAVVNHPWQSAMLHLHVLASPPFILVFGVILNSHIMKKLKANRIPNRKSGLGSLATFAAMVVSGYLLQVATADAWLQALVIVHIASSAAFSAVYATHLVVSYTLLRRTAATRIQEVA